MTLLEGILSVTLALLFIYLMIGLFLWLSNYEVVKAGLELDKEPKPPLWLLSAAAIVLWPWMHYKKYREEWEEYQNGQREKEFNKIAYASRRSYETPERTSGISGLYLRESVDQSHKERVASYFDPYEHASWDESIPMALQELVGSDDSDRDPELEFPSTERGIPFEWRPSDPTPSPVETSSAAPSQSESWGSSQSDSGMGSDYSGSSGSDSCSSSYDSSSGSCGGE